MGIVPLSECQGDLYETKFGLYEDRFARTAASIRRRQRRFLLFSTQHPTNFKCADVICDFCGFLAQVKSIASTDLTKIPPTVLGAAWSVQKARMDAGIYFPLFLVLMRGHESAIYYLSADVQKPEMFKPRKLLGANARRAGWQGFLYLLKDVKAAFVRVC
jgi:Dam-replacing family